jgi:hypothetical protein
VLIQPAKIGDKSADMFKPFRTTKDLSKAFHPLGEDLRHPNNWQHDSTFFFYLTPLIFLHSPIFPNNLPSRVKKFQKAAIGIFGAFVNSAHVTINKVESGRMVRQDRLGGLLSYYYRDAA